MAKQIGNTDLIDTWASEGNIVDPDPSKKEEGWLLGEQPPHEWMNHIQNEHGQKINRLLDDTYSNGLSLRQELDGDVANGQGARLVRGAVIYVNTVADLQALDTSGLAEGQAASVQGSEFRWDGGEWKPISAVTLLAFGATPDGDREGGGTDNTDAFNSAYEWLESTGYRVPIKVTAHGTGCYRVDGRIQGKASTTFVFEEGATVDFTSSTLSFSSDSGAWEFKGEFSGGEVNTAQNLGIGDDVIETETPHGLSVDDIFLIKSQRNSLHSDAGAYRLGRATTNVDHHALYFGEPCIVDEVISPTQVRVKNGLIFPDYRTDDSEETSPAADRPRTTIQKMVLLESPQIIGGEFLSVDNTVFHFELCKNGSVKNAKFFFGEGTGHSVLSRYSYKCSYKNLYTKHPENDYVTQSASRYNTYKSRSDWFTQWDVEDVNGVQSFDATYVLDGVPTLFLDIQRVHAVNPLVNGLTFHSGCYGWKASNVFVSGARAASIFLRSRNGTLSNFFIENTSSSLGGLSLSEWAADLTITSGTINSAGSAFSIRTQSELPGDPLEQVEPRRNIVISNLVLDVGGIGRIHNRPGSASSIETPTIERSGITITNINIKNFSAPLVIENYVHGVICDNWQAKSVGDYDGPAIEIRSDSTLHTISSIYRNSTTPAPAVSNLGLTLDDAVFSRSVYPFRATGTIVRDCISSSQGAGVVERDFIKSRITADFTLSNIVAREGVLDFGSGASNNRTLTVPEYNESGVQGVGVGSKVVLVNSSSSFSLTVSAPSGVTLDDSRKGDSVIGPETTATIEHVYKNYWIIY